MAGKKRKTENFIINPKNKEVINNTNNNSNTINLNQDEQKIILPRKRAVALIHKKASIPTKENEPEKKTNKIINLNFSFIESLSRMFEKQKDCNFSQIFEQYTKFYNENKEDVKFSDIFTKKLNASDNLNISKNNVFEKLFGKEKVKTGNETEIFDKVFKKTDVEDSGFSKIFGKEEEKSIDKKQKKNE
ncbi:hypothetical protein GVAV_002908 [Gurleya vavrai]